MLHLTMLHLTLWPHYTMREKRGELLDIVLTWSPRCLAHVNAGVAIDCVMSIARQASLLTQSAFALLGYSCIYVCETLRGLQVSTLWEYKDTTMSSNSPLFSRIV